MTHWLVITHERGKDGTAIARLEAKGFKVYQPRVRESLTCKPPMFRGYMFVAYNPDWRIIGRQQGVRRLLYLAGSEGVGSDPIPALIPDEFIEWCREQEGLSEERAQPFEPGDKAIYHGRSTLGINEWEVPVTIQGIDSKGRVEILMTFMGKLHRQRVPADKLRKVG